MLTAYLYLNRPLDEIDKGEITEQTSDPSVQIPPLDNKNSVQTPGEPLKSPDIQMPFITDKEQVEITKKNNETALIAIEKFKQGDYESAIKLFKELSEKDPSAFTGVGISYFKLEDYTNAINFLEKAVEHNNNDFVARKFLAFAYYRRDDLERSLNNAEIGLSIKKDQELQALYDKLKREKRTQQNYIEESTLHFKILFDGYEHGRVNREIISILEDAYGFVGRELNYFPSDSVTVILYTNRDFYDTTQAPMWSDGIYDGKIRIPIKGVEGQSAALKKVLFHEYTHAAVYSLTHKCPLWINEGLAEYFSKSYPKKSARRFLYIISRIHSQVSAVGMSLLLIGKVIRQFRTL